MGILKQQIVQAIKDELDRQNQSGVMDSPYIYDYEDKDCIGIDGHVDIGAIADSVIKIVTS